MHKRRKGSPSVAPSELRGSILHITNLSAKVQKHQHVEGLRKLGMKHELHHIPSPGAKSAAKEKGSVGPVQEHRDRITVSRNTPKRPRVRARIV